MKRNTIKVDCYLTASIEEVWGKLQMLEMLQYVASPYATFKPIDNTKVKWIEGEKSKFHLKLFKIIPIGVHTINVVKCSKTDYIIYTNENNRMIPVWNHKIILKEVNENCCYYTDEVEIGAGWKTVIVSLWSLCFYKHRQKKWRNLLNKSIK